MSNPASSTSVVVVSGADTPNIDFTLGTGGSISGTVTNASTSAPIVGASVGAMRIGAPGGGQATTTAGGVYTITGLAPGNYKVVANADGFVHEFWQEVLDPASSTPVTVVDGADTSNIDFTLGAGGAIEGTVLELVGGAPVANVEVLFFPFGEPWPPNGPPPGQVETDANGNYFADGVPPGAYRAVVIASEQDYMAQFFDHVSNPASSSPVVVTAGVTTTNIDFDLEKGGSVSGTVFEADGTTPIEGISLEAETLVGGIVVAVTESDENGDYHLGGLPPGTFVILAIDDQGLGFAEEYFDGAAIPVGAVPMVIAGPATHLVGADFTLEPAGP